MSLDVWFKSDISNILLAMAETAMAAYRESEPDTIPAYMRGYMQALHGASVAFGIAEPRLLPPVAEVEQAKRDAFSAAEEQQQ